jgi:hypothetical protein
VLADERAVRGRRGRARSRGRHLQERADHAWRGGGGVADGTGRGSGRPRLGDAVTVRPAYLQKATTYLVQSVDFGLLGSATGEDLMTNGVAVIESATTAAHILVFIAQP